MKNLSIKGYKKNSPDKDRSYNIIPNGEITMKNVEFPVLGIDNKGYSKVMEPGKDYSYPGDIVLEIPIKKQTIYNRIFKNRMK